MLKKLTIVLGMAVAVAGTTTVSSFVFVPEAQAFGIKSIKKAAKKVGRKAKKGGKAVGRTTKKGGKAIGRAAKRSGKGYGYVGAYTGRAVARGGKRIGRGAKRAGTVAGRIAKDYGKMGRCIVKRACKGKIGPRQPGTI